jgi:hypothetical protein
MAWDLRLDPKTRDLRPGIVTGQDEIVQRVLTRLWRHLGEWFVNTSAGLPWYAGPSDLMAGKLTDRTAIMGTRNFRYADLWIRNEIAETAGVIKVVDFNTRFEAATRTYSIRAQIVTEYGLPYLLRFERVLDARAFFEEAV